MKTILHIIICIALVWLLTNCTHYVEPTGTKLTQVGGVFYKSPTGEIYINNETSFEDTTDVVETYTNWWGAAKMLGISTKGDVDKVKSNNDVTKTVDGNRSAEAINQSNNSLKAEELKYLVE